MALIFEIFQNLIIVRIINIHRMIISIKATPIIWNLKNMGVHKPFNTSWSRKNTRAIFTGFLSIPCFHTKKADMPIRIYKIVHTTPNIQLGGL
jgi:hypothetical protein